MSKLEEIASAVSENALVLSIVTGFELSKLNEEVGANIRCLKDE